MTIGGHRGAPAIESMIALTSAPEVLVRNLLSSCSHRAERMEAAWADQRLERKLCMDDGPSDAPRRSRSDGWQGRLVLPG
jgi:hypothetical protein